MGKTFQFPHDTLHAYLEDKENLELRDELIEQAIPVVERTATAIVEGAKVWLPQHIDEDELVSEGLVQLTPIVEEFNPLFRDDLSSAFYVHVRKRAYWRLLDYIRNERLQSRTTIDHALRFKAAFSALKNETGYAPMIGEVAERLGISSLIAEEWRVLALELDVRNISIDQELRASKRASGAVSLHDILVEAECSAQEDADYGFFALLPPSLSEIERAIVISVYRDNKTMSDIGSAFGLSESRISQMFASILPRIRTAYFERLTRKDGE